MKILNFGSCNIDYVYTLDHIVVSGEIDTSCNMGLFPGGKGYNQSIAMSRAGAKVYHACCVGNDGDMFIDVLKENGVDVSLMETVDVKNGHAIIQVSNAWEYSVFLHPGSNEMISKEYIDRVLEHFGEGDMILLQNEISNIDYIIDRAYLKKMRIILNPSPFNEKLKKIDLNKLFCLVLNETEAKRFSGLNDYEKCMSYFRNNFPELKIMINLANNGSLYGDKTQVLYQSAFQVDVVDTTGSGDTFTGYCAAGVALGIDSAVIIRNATAASAISATRKGAASSIPFMEEVRDLLKVLKQSPQIRKDIIEKMEAYFDANLLDANLVELARLIGYSPVYAGNIIKKLTGKSFSKNLQDKRCCIAAQLLLETDLSVEDIIRKIGYENGSFFRRIFKNKYGVNLLEYRKKEGN